MFFRRSLAVFLTLFFVLVSLLMFLLYGIYNTYLNPNFYTNEFSVGAYDFLVNTTVDRIRVNDSLISRSFSADELRSEITGVFTQDLFVTVAKDLSKQVEKIKYDPRQPIVISLKSFRTSLLTVSNNLAFKIFKKLPVCEGGQTPQIQESSLPTCVPEGVQYNSVASPLAGRFEKAIYIAVPEQIQYDLSATGDSGNSIIINFLEWVDSVKYFLYVILLFILVSIALLVYVPFSDILKYEGLAFAMSGIFGYLLSFMILPLPKIMFRQLPEQYLQAQYFAETLISFLSYNVQKISLIFLAFGGVLILLQFFLRRKY